MKKSILTLALAAMCCTAAFAQGRSALRLNEVMVENDSSIVDEYGNHTGWIELFNSNFSPLEISSIYITNDKNDPKKYPVPLGDVNTKIAKRQHVVFYTDGEPNKGTFHTNFTLTPGQDNWIGIYDADGITLIDEVLVPAELVCDNTWARTEDGAGEWAVRTGGENDYITPSSANIIKGTNPKIEEFATQDAHGWGMAVMAMAIVFSALLVLCLCFYAIGKIGAMVTRMNKARSQGLTRQEAKAENLAHDSGEEIAAIVTLMTPRILSLQSIK